MVMIHVAFNIDEPYIEKTKVVIRSILAHVSKPITFHVIGVEQFEFEKEINIKCYSKPNIDCLKYIKPVGHITIASVYRLFFPFILNDIDKVIYIDIDTVVLEDLYKLWLYEPKYIAGVTDPMYKDLADKNNLKHNYINTGVLLFNLKNLRQINYLERIKSTQTGEYDLLLLDQDIINIAFTDLIEHLPERWNTYGNYYPQFTYQMHEAHLNPAIIHWCGARKPWNNDVWKGEEWEKWNI